MNVDNLIKELNKISREDRKFVNVFIYDTQRPWNYPLRKITRQNFVTLSLEYKREN
jgi:hypothetical protein